MRVIVGLIGVKGCGKDTAAQPLVQACGFQRIGFADALYREATQAFGVEVASFETRATKELAQPHLALKYCKDPLYVRCVLAHLGFLGADADVLEQQMAVPRSPRVTLQCWGTEYRRRGFPGVHVGEDSYWLDTVRRVMQAQPERSFIVTDVRFLTEYRFIRECHGTLVRVRRPALEARAALERARNGTAAHPSETELLDIVVDAEVQNTEGQPSCLIDAMLELHASLAPGQPA